MERGEKKAQEKKKARGRKEREADDAGREKVRKRKIEGTRIEIIAGKKDK